MKKKARYFGLYDIIIYIFLFTFFFLLGSKISDFSDINAKNVEIYVDGELKYIYPLQKDEKNIFVDTSIGGVNVKFKDNMVRVTTSNSPYKLNVKQGWIKSSGEMIIGIPDRLLIKIVGETEDEDDLDSILR